MKKVGLVLFMVILSFITSCSMVELRLYLPGEYISDAVLKKFTLETGINVSKMEFDSNEIAVPSIEDMSNSFDIVIPSDYALEELVTKDLLQEIDYSLVKGFDYDCSITEGLKEILNRLKTDNSTGNGGFDLLKYGVPYFWGNVGLIVNNNIISDSSILAEFGWSALKNNYASLLYDSSRDAFMIALKEIAYQSGKNQIINNPTKAELDLAEEWLRDLYSKSECKYGVDLSLREMVDPNTKYALAIDYSGNAIYLSEQHDYLSYFVPNSGTNVWVDAMAIPKNSKNIDLAYQFISFILRKDIQIMNSKDMGYTAITKEAYDSIVSEGYYSKSYEINISKNDEIYRYNPILKADIDSRYRLIKGQ